MDWCKAFLSERRQRVVMGEHSSDWESVKSGVPQGSVLDPLFFVIFINDLPDNVRNMLKIYADDSKLIAKIDCEEDVVRFQEDLNEIDKWSKLWLLRLNPKKCKIMHFGGKSLDQEYKMDGILLEETDLEKDLGVFISNDLSWAKQVEATTTKGYQMIGRIRRSFKHLNAQNIKLLYQSLVRPHLEYAVSVWNPYKKNEIQKMEKVQRYATKMGSLKHMKYPKRLETLKLTSHQERRRRGDLIQQFKILKKVDIVNWCSKVCVVNSKVRGEKLAKDAKKLDSRLFFFKNRILNDWNVLG